VCDQPAICAQHRKLSQSSESKTAFALSRFACRARASMPGIPEFHEIVPSRSRSDRCNRRRSSARISSTKSRRDVATTSPRALVCPRRDNRDDRQGSDDRDDRRAKRKRKRKRKKKIVGPIKFFHVFDHEPLRLLGRLISARWNGNGKTHLGRESPDVKGP